ncbi:hypothetical protein Leryth_020698 [Lithospermum erythrorhizon]|nr:hypothetical protein Leryth_020698 [Lithospermum erythrorhizon]
MIYSGSMQHRGESDSTSVNGDEPSLHFKWWYVVRILQWHHTEGLLIPSLVIDWVLNQLLEKGLLGVLQLLLPIIYGVIETIVLSQSYVRTLVGVAVRFIREPSPGGSDLVDNSRRAYTFSSLVEMLHYLILAVPDTFVALDCLHLPSNIATPGVNDGNCISKVGESSANNGSLFVAHVLKDKRIESVTEGVSVDRLVSSINKCCDNLARATRPGNLGKNMAKTVQELDKTLTHGDVRMAYKYLFDNLCDMADERWITEVSSCLRSSLKYISTVPLSLISSVFFVCEWATCDYRDFRTAPPDSLKFSGKKDLSVIYIAVRLLKLKMRDMQSSSSRRDESIAKKDSDPQNMFSGKFSVAKGLDNQNTQRVEAKIMKHSEVFESPGPIHDIIVCWIDQHEVENGEGFKCLQLLIAELIRAGIFYPQVYVKQLIVSGVIDVTGDSVDEVRWKRHYKILKEFPGPYVRDALEEARIAQPQAVLEAITTYSNERRIVLNKHHKNCENSFVTRSSHRQKHHYTLAVDGVSPSIDEQKHVASGVSVPTRTAKRSVELEDLKASISLLLRLPCSSLKDSLVDEPQVIAKKVTCLNSSKMDTSDETHDCEECRKVKRRKPSEERCSSNPSDEDGLWWIRKGPKSLESFRADPPPKPVKQTSRGRQKVVRKTQSLAQLAAARIEGSQSASTSHVCDIKACCPHHRSEGEGDLLKSVGRTRTAHSGDVVSIGKVLKKLRLAEKRTMVVWLIARVKKLFEEAEKVSTVPNSNHYGRPSPAVDDPNSVQWKVREDDLSAILYLMDISSELVLSVNFLLWLLPKVLSNSVSTIHAGKNVLMFPRNVGNHPCEIGEGFLLSCIRRYENIIVSMDLIPETLSALMGRAAPTMVPNGRVSVLPSLMYARHLLKKYGNVTSVVEWEKRFKLSCDKRLVSELESGKLLNDEYGFSLGVPAGVEDLDNFFRQKISGVRVSRVGLSMRDIVQRHVDEAFQLCYGKERKSFGPNSIRSPNIEKIDDCYQMAEQIVMRLTECMKQTGGAAQEGDPNLVASAISAIVGSVGQVIAKVPEFNSLNNHIKVSSTSTSLNFSRHMLRVHLMCLCLLKEALGERQSRVFEVALASESSSILAQLFAPGKVPRSQFQLSSESLDSNIKVTAAISALVIGAILHGIINLERMVTLFRLKDGLDFVQFVRNLKSNSNGNARTIGPSKVDNMVEVSVHWFRLLVGNCRTIADGLIVDLLGEPAVVALSRIQRTLPLGLVFPPAYYISSFVLWRPFIINNGIGTRDDIIQLYKSLELAVGDAMKHLPFREVCLRDTHGLHNLMSLDTLDSQFAAMLEGNGLDIHLKATAFLPLRARLFLNALVDCRLPQSALKQDEGNRMASQGELKFHHAGKDPKLLQKIVHVLDTLQPAKFHWQWVELRLLLNEQAVAEKLEADTSLVEAIRFASPNPDKIAASENESNFIEILLTRLLVRPDAATLFSEVVHLFGRSLEDSMLMQVKWFLGGNDVLFGRKSVRQRLKNIAEIKGLSTKCRYWKPWGWCHSISEPMIRKGTKRKLEVSSVEEGEVVEDGLEAKQLLRGSIQIEDLEGCVVTQQLTERALIELVLPCVDKSSDDSRITFASDMIKQMSNIEQQISSVMRGASKNTGTGNLVTEGTTTKGNVRKGVRGGNAGVTRRPTVPAETVPPSPAALRASMSLRMQFLLRLLPIIYVDREPVGRNIRHMLASVVLRLLGSRVVHEDACYSYKPSWNSIKQEEPLYAAFLILSRERLFDSLLLVLHGLLSSSQPSWLKLNFRSKESTDCCKEFYMFDREMVESLQNDLDHMHLPEPVRWRIQTAMPILSPSVRWLLSCQPPSVSPVALQPSNPSSVRQRGSTNQHQKTQSVSAGKPKPLLVQQELDLEVDPWALLEEGAGSGPSSSVSSAAGGSEHANIRASNWLKGAVRVRRTDLTYIGSVDEDS